MTLRRRWWRQLLAGALLVNVLHAAVAPLPPAPPEIYGPLFLAVQRQAVFPDQKTFVDAVPRGDPGEIVARFTSAEPPLQGAELRLFVDAHFLLPEVAAPAVPPAGSLEDHLHQLWPVLRRAPDRRVRGSSLLPLPNPYVVPGGRFREVYYWDSYFTMLGLRESGEEDLLRAMVDNFAYQATNYGLIPNGNRTYYLSRSQPPFFALMVELLAERHGEQTYLRYRDALRAEYAYWTDRGRRTRHVVALPEGGRLARYWDRLDEPRPESFLQDEQVAREAREAVGRRPSRVWRDLRSAAESGWDFSSRWLGDGRTLATIETTDLVPVDLNCLLYQLEQTLARSERLAGERRAAERLREAAEARRAAILRYCWSESAGFFVDYHLRHRRPAEALTLAGMAPLFFRIASRQQAAAAAEVVATRFLQPGGVVTTLAETGQQWDWPNGWAPLQWMTVQGLKHYGFDALAEDIARRWIGLNQEVYERTGRMMEKYNVVDPSVPAGGGEYETQDGFGWTNGVLLKLMALYPDEPAEAPRESIPEITGEGERENPVGSAPAAGSGAP